MNVFMIATWSMSYDGVEIGSTLLENNNPSEIALAKAINNVEDNPKFTSVGYGGLPNINGDVEQDAAFMNGENLKIGALAGVKNIENVIDVAITLSKEKYNNMLIGTGAEKYGIAKGASFKNMLTHSAQQSYDEKRNSFIGSDLNSYDGHDTVGMISKDVFGNISVGVSTSGLSMKREGRVGDSPISGSGFYADSNIGGATATGVGEDLMRGCLSYDAVKLIESGMSSQNAAETALRSFEKKLTSKGEKIRAMSLIVLDKDGDFGIATNCWFTFVTYDKKNGVVKHLAEMVEGKTVYKKEN